MQPRQTGQLLDICLAQDLVKGTASLYVKARKFFDTLAAQLVRQGHTLDIFACSLDQVRLSHCPPALALTFFSSCQPGAACHRVQHDTGGCYVPKLHLVNLSCNLQGNIVDLQRPIIYYEHVKRGNHHRKSVFSLLMDGIHYFVALKHGEYSGMVGTISTPKTCGDNGCRWG